MKLREHIPRGVFVACKLVHEIGETMTLSPSFLLAYWLVCLPCFGHKDMKDR